MLSTLQPRSLDFHQLLFLGHVCLWLFVCFAKILSASIDLHVNVYVDFFFYEICLDYVGDVI